MQLTRMVFVLPAGQRGPRTLAVEAASPQHEATATHLQWIFPAGGSKQAKYGKYTIILLISTAEHEQGVCLIHLILYTNTQSRTSVHTRGKRRQYLITTALVHTYHTNSVSAIQYNNWRLAIGRWSVCIWYCYQLTEYLGLAYWRKFFLSGSLPTLIRR